MSRLFHGTPITILQRGLADLNYGTIIIRIMLQSNKRRRSHASRTAGREKADVLVARREANAMPSLPCRRCSYLNTLLSNRLGV